jgi:hypothetical protein
LFREGFNKKTHYFMEFSKIVAYLVLGCTDSGGYVEFNPKYILVGGERGASNFKVSIIFFW